MAANALILTSLILAFPRFVRFKIKRHLIVSIERSATGNIGIITYDNKAHIYDINNTHMTKGGSDAVLRYFLSQRNGFLRG